MNKITIPRDFIYEFTLDKNLVKNYYERILTYKLEFIHNTAGGSTGYAYPIPYDETLVNEITRCVNQVGSEYLNAKLKICDIWLTKSEMMQVSKLHSHSLSIFSGVLYLHDNNVDTIFSVPDEFVSQHNSFLGVACKDVNENTIRIKPEVGKLLIWPSYIKHRISANKTKNIRHTIAFNSFFEGELSTESTQRLSLRTEDPEYL